LPAHSSIRGANVIASRQGPWCHGGPPTPLLKQGKEDHRTNVKKIASQGRHCPWPSARQVEEEIRHDKDRGGRRVTHHQQAAVAARMVG
jgi:hypothetical protein